MFNAVQQHEPDERGDVHAVLRQRQTAIPRRFDERAARLVELRQHVDEDVRDRHAGRGRRDPATADGQRRGEPPARDEDGGEKQRSDETLEHGAVRQNGPM